MNNPKLTVEQQINYLEDKGVRFEIVSKEAALAYLSNNNNYFKLTAYRTMFSKYSEGPNKGKYIALDFAHLQDLAIIDMRFRYILLQMALDIEHFAKGRLLHCIERSPEDGYSIVSDYRAQLNENTKDALKRELNNNRNNPYCGSIINKYEPDYPIWAFIEIIPFGRFVSFYQYCSNILKECEFCNNKRRKCSLRSEYCMLSEIKHLRNAAAHNNCIINNLAPNNHTLDNRLSIELSRCGISKQTRRSKLSNVRIHQITTLLFAHKEMIKSEGVHLNRGQLLHEVVSRMFRNFAFYDNGINRTIATSFIYFEKIVDKWFPITYNDNTT